MPGLAFFFGWQVSLPPPFRNQSADVLDSPAGGSRAKFDGLRKAPGLDALPPDCLADGDDGRDRGHGFWVADDLRKANKASFRHVAHMH